MGQLKIVKMRFDFSNPYDVATYKKLGESARRGYRRNRGSQARYLASVMLGVRPYEGLECAGLTERPYFAPDVDELYKNAKAQLRELSSGASALVQSSRRNGIASKSRPILRLLPNELDKGSLLTSADPRTSDSL